MSIQDPPFDGKPCPMCPREIRQLAAVAHNTITAWKDPSRRHKIPERLAALEEALMAVQPLVDAHFASRMHSHGEVDRSEPSEGVAAKEEP